jgi:hypothetical protein
MSNIKLFESRQIRIVWNEIKNPELATQRTRELYKPKGYPDDSKKGFIENKIAAKQGGSVAGKASLI